MRLLKEIHQQEMVIAEDRFARINLRSKKRDGIKVKNNI